MFVYQRVHHVIHALEDRFPAWRSWEASPWHGTVNVKIGARVPAITGHPSVFFLCTCQLDIVSYPIIGKQKNHETPMALESQHEYIYIWYTIYNICYTYIYVIYIYMSVVRLSKGWVCSPGISWCCWRGSLPRIAHGFWGALSDKCMSIDIILTYIQ